VEIFGDQAMTGIFVRIGPNVDYTIQLYNRHTCQNVAFLGAFDLLGLTLSTSLATSDPSEMDHDDPFSHHHQLVSTSYEALCSLLLVWTSQRQVSELMHGTCNLW
jgi:hypothetical protein